LAVPKSIPIRLPEKENICMSNYIISRSKSLLALYF